jgi:hypothetical protein
MTPGLLNEVWGISEGAISQQCGLAQPNRIWLVYKTASSRPVMRLLIKNDSEHVAYWVILLLPSGA